MARGALLLLLLALAVLLPRPARAEIGACNVIDTLPTTILASGRYCLDQDIIGTYSGSYALRIYADNVVFDCNGFRLADTNAANTNAGIYVQGDHRDVTIRNCVVEGFQTGIFVQESGDDGSSGHVIEDNAVVGARITGIMASGSNMRIERNRVTGVRGNSSNGPAYGIYLYSSYGNGVGNTVRDNIISDFKPAPPSGGSTVIGLVFFQLHETEVTGNTISGIYATTGHVAYGIDSSNASGSTLVGNHILSGPPLPAPLDGAQAVGIHLTGTLEQQATNTCRDNVVGHFTTADIVGCTVVSSTQF